MPKGKAKKSAKSAKSAKSKKSTDGDGAENEGGIEAAAADAAAAETSGGQGSASAAESPFPPPTPQGRLAGYSRIDAAIDCTHTLGQALEVYGFDKEK